MIYRILLTLFITSLTLAQPLSAQDNRYRVEVIVLQHLNHTEEAKELNGLTDYTESIDFLTPKPGDFLPEEDSEEPATDATNAGPARIDDASLTGNPESEPDPNAVFQVEEMTEVMQDAWRRLRLSGPFRPLQYLSWEQGRSEPFPSVRIHDSNLLMISDPLGDQRLRLETDEIIRQFATDPRREPRNLSQPGPDEADPPPSALDLLPPVSHFYALDGTLSLVRTRFLHFYIDLQTREAVYEAPEPDPVRPGSLLSAKPQKPYEAESSLDREGLEAEEEALPSSFLVHSMQQNRQVRSGRMEYFDGPVLSVLAYITAIPLDEDEN